MITEVYFMRHSRILNVSNEDSNDNLQLKNEKSILSIEGEELAKTISRIEEFKNLDIVISSNYVRSMSTAKYFIRDKNLIVIDEFGERVHGVNFYKELPVNFEMNQFNDFNYKMDNGESLNEVRDRMLNSLMKLLNKYKGSKILIVSHATAMASLFSFWCDVNYDSSYYYNEEEFFDGNWNYCETFKLLFSDNNELLDIINIDLDDYRR